MVKYPDVERGFHSTATLTFIAHDAAGNPVLGLVLSTRHEGVQDITLSDWKDNGDGSYTQVLTTGAMSGTLTLMPQLNGVDAAKAPPWLISFLFRHPELTRQLRLIRAVISPAILSR
ncbi:invasin domain 3-containing protein [Shigella flexneri]